MHFLVVYNGLYRTMTSGGGEGHRTSGGRYGPELGSEPATWQKRSGVGGGGDYRRTTDLVVDTF